MKIITITFLFISITATRIFPQQIFADTLGIKIQQEQKQILGLTTLTYKSIEYKFVDETYFRTCFQGRDTLHLFSFGMCCTEIGRGGHMLDLIGRTFIISHDSLIFFRESHVEFFNSIYNLKNIEIKDCVVTVTNTRRGITLLQSEPTLLYTQKVDALDFEKLSEALNTTSKNENQPNKDAKKMKTLIKL